MSVLGGGRVLLSGWLRSLTQDLRPARGGVQHLDIYGDPGFADLLEHWGEAHVWPEIRLLLGGRRGKVLDLACGTARTFDFLRSEPGLELYGCDISPLLIERAITRGYPAERLHVADATATPYVDAAFDYCYSIGSLEHFTEAGIDRFLAETHRLCRGLGFHQIPVSRSGFNEGWITPYQAYWNNSERWWRARFTAVFGKRVHVMSSGWDDAQSRGVWFITAAPGFLATSPT